MGKEKVDPGNILRCAAENFGNNQTIKDCIECFSAEMDFTSQSGLDAAKACATQYWPKGVAACGTEISAMAPGNMETLESVVGCFDDRLEKENAERCLGEATSTQLQDQMTEATMCILDSWKWAMGMVKSVNGRKRPRGGRGRGGRGKRAAKEKDPAVLADITACSKEHLAPAYDECTKIMEAGTDPKAAHKCYNNILLGNVVSECINEKNVSTADAESLNLPQGCKDAWRP